MVPVPPADRTANAPVHDEPPPAASHPASLPAPTPSTPALKILMVEGEATDAELIRRALLRGGMDFTARRVATRAEFVEALESFAPDVLLLDYKLPGYSGTEALAHARQAHPEIPVVVVTGTIGDEAAIELLKSGAKDYVLKNNLLRLPPAIERAVTVEQGIRARKAAERALRESNALLETVERIAHVGGFDWDIASGRIVWSEEIYRMFGRAAGTFVPTLPSFIDCVHPDDQGRVRAAIDASVTRNEPFDIEYRIQRPDGAERIIQARGEVTRDATGAPIGMTGTGHDITERKRAEAQIREDEARFRGLVEQNVAGIMMIRQDATIGYLNPYWARLNGYTAAEVIGHSIFEYVADAEKQRVADELKKQFSGGGFVQLETAMLAKDGHNTDILVNASAGTFEGRPASIAVLLDITERNKAQRELASTAAILATEHELSPDGILVVDQAEQIVSVNRRFAEIFGVPAKLLADKADEPVLQWAVGQIADSAAFLARVRYLYDHREEASAEEITLKDGRVLERHSEPMNRAGGEYAGRVWFFRDISERKRAEETLRTSEERFRLVIEEAPDAVLLYDCDQDRFISANKAAERLFACGRDKILKYGPQHFYPPEQPDAQQVDQSFADHNERALAGEELCYERRILNAAGEERLCQVTLVRLPSAAANLLRASYVDVTDARAAEQTLRRLNRTLRTLSRGNEALVRVAGEHELLEEMCRVIVETGGYRMAWIGRATARRRQVGDAARLGRRNRPLPRNGPHDLGRGGLW